MGSKESSSTQESKPPAWSKPLFETSAQDAMGLYQSGSGGNTYMGSTVAPLSGTTMQGVNQLANAGQNTDTSGTRPLYQQLGAGAVSNPAINALSNVAGGVTGGQTDVSGVNAQNVGAGDYQGILERAQAPTSASQNLQGYASGEYLQGEGNPFYRQRLEKEIADSNALIQSQFSGAGRYGSGANQGTIAENTSDMLYRGLEDDFNRQTQNQFNAVGMIDAANQGALGTQLGAASGIAGIGAGNADRALQAGTARAGFDAADLDRGLSAAGLQGNLLSSAGNLYGQGIGQGLDAAGSMAGLDQQQFENRLTGAGATLQAGGIMDQQAQRQIQDEIAKFYALDNEDWNRLGMLQSAAAGSAGNYGTQNATQRNPINWVEAGSNLLGGGK